MRTHFSTLKMGDVLIELRSVEKAVEQLFATKPHPVKLSFENLRYSVNSNPGDSGSPLKEILFGLSGEIRPGEMVAIMGPSGSSKTTLLNALASRLPPDQLSGNILYNGRPTDKSSKRITSYVLQDDVMHSALSVYETLFYTAMLKLPGDLPYETKIERVDKAITALGLDGCKNSPVGNFFMRGISGGERKRLNIGNEILNNPSVMLLDEPTSGLDSSTAYLIIEMLKLFAKQSRTVVCSIHQPSSQIFMSFDNVILLAKGHMVYYGPPKKVVEYFENLGFQCDPHWNPADFFVELASKDEATISFLAQNFKSLRESVPTMSESQNIENTLGVTEMEHETRKWETNWYQQFYYLSLRCFAIKKNASLTNMNIYQTIAIALIVGVLWFQLPTEENTLQERIGLVFFTAIFLSFKPMFDAMLLFPAERPILMKERATGSYRLSAYYLAKCMSEIPLTIFFPTLFVVIVYWMTGLNPNFGRFILFMLAMGLTVMTSESLGIIFSAAFMDFQMATTCATIVFLGFMLLGGFYIESSNIPVWIRWVQWISPVKYAYELLLKIEFNGRSFTCAEGTDSVFDFCPSREISGDEALKKFELDTDAGLAIGVLIAMIILFRYMSYIFLRITSKSSF